MILPSRRDIAGIALISSLGLLGAGCASVFAPDCARYEEARKHADYTPRYQHSDAKTRALADEVKPLPGKALAAAPLYKAVPSNGSVRQCTDLTVRKELFLQRSVRAKSLIVEETREIFTVGGKRVASRVIDLSDQLTQAGYYTSREILPIPEATPAGRYRIVNRLTYRTRAKAKPALLARTTLEFEVPPREKR